MYTMQLALSEKVGCDEVARFLQNICPGKRAKKGEVLVTERIPPNIHGQRSHAIERCNQWCESIYA
jgi:hypothetical protein